MSHCVRVHIGFAVRKCKKCSFEYVMNEEFRKHMSEKHGGRATATPLELSREQMQTCQKVFQYLVSQGIDALKKEADRLTEKLQQ